MASNAFLMKVLHSVIFSGQGVEAPRWGKSVALKWMALQSHFFQIPHLVYIFKENIYFLSLHLNCEIFLSEETLISMLFW